MRSLLGLGDGGRLGNGVWNRDGLVRADLGEDAPERGERSPSRESAGPAAVADSDFARVVLKSISSSSSTESWKESERSGHCREGGRRRTNGRRWRSGRRTRQLEACPPRVRTSPAPGGFCALDCQRTEQSVAPSSLRGSRQGSVHRLLLREPEAELVSIPQPAAFSIADAATVLSGQTMEASRA